MRKLKGQKDLVNYSAKIALEFGNVARAILYSQIIYWRDIKQRSEFYKTDKERSLELWLWLSEIKYTKKRLKDNWYIITQHKRLDHSTSYIVEENQLNTLLIKLYWETYQNKEHCQNWPSVKSELTLGKVKSDNSESQNWPSVKSELTLDIWTEITTETTTESEYEDKQPPPPQNFDKVEYIAKMRDAEKRGIYRLTIWNNLTWRQDFLTAEMKKQFVLLNSVSLEEFKSRAEKFEAIKTLILAKKMEKYFFSKIWERDLEKFLAKFNDFGAEDEQIISKLAMFGEEKKALRILATPSEPTELPPPPKKEQSEEEKQASKEILETQRQKLLSKLSTQ